SKNSATVRFVDSANRDFHLSGTDTVARDAGVSLSADTYLAFSSDVDGSLRPNGTAWDIGADEYLDLAAPSVPAGLQASAASPTQINLSWNPSTDDVEVAGYHVYRNTALVATVTATSYSDTGLTASTTYSYTVDAFDAVPNTSAQSSPPVQATTLSAPDTTPPTGTIVINQGATSTRSTAVTLTLSCSDNSSGCTRMQFSNDGTSWSTAEAYATTKAWTLSSGDNSKTVRVKYYDGAGNPSVAYSDTILLDTTPPPTSTATPPGGNYSTPQSVTLTCSDGTGSGCAQIYYTTDGSTPTTNSSIYSSPINIATNTTLKFVARDLAGNPDPIRTEHIKTEVYYIGNTPPVGYIDSISPSSITAGELVTFTGHGTDADGTITGYNWRSSISGQLSAATSFSTSALPAGTHTIYFKVQDNTGEWSTEVNQSLTVSQGQYELGTSDMVINAGAANVTPPSGRSTIPVYSAGATLDQEGKEYVLQNNVSASGTAFVIAAHNVTLNLNGYTITYGTGGGTAPAYGVYIEGGAYSRGYAGLAIVNGTIKQSPSSSCAGDTDPKRYGINCNPIYAYKTDGMEIGGLTISYHTDDTNGIHMSYGWNANIHHNTIQDTGAVLSDRHQAIKVIQTENLDTMKIHHNSVTARHIGIKAGYNAEVYNNQVTINSIDTNSFGISVRNGAAHHNKVYGTGVHPIAFWCEESTKIYTNYAEVQNTKWGAEYGDTGSSCYRMVWGNGKDSEIMYNTCILHATANYNNKGWDSWGRGFWLGLPDETLSTDLHDNVIIATNNDGIAKAAAIAIVSNNVSPNLKIRNNRVESNWANVLLADHYGHADGYAQFIDNTFVKRDNYSSYRTIKSEYSSIPSTGTFISNDMEGGASMDSINLEFNGTDAEDQKEIRVGWHLNITVRDTANNLVNNADVDVYEYDDPVSPAFSGKTGSNGTVSTDAIQYHRTNKTTSGTPMGDGSYKVYKTPHTIRARYGSKSGTTQVNLTGDQSVTVTIQ
ncbi:MAG: chitobiase/beta-hexosaminidase C-terminal domain-containing protein, partial [Alphaproteobacteria bacterium]|nr:chitobiase/beta-hexosaminidase C-terminal domain-containing protein [Candidatus Nitrobium versatile]